MVEKLVFLLEVGGKLCVWCFVGAGREIMCGRDVRSGRDVMCAVFYLRWEGRYVCSVLLEVGGKLCV